MQGFEAPQQGYWASLTAREQSELALLAQRVAVSSGETLLSIQDESREVLIVWSGLVKVVVHYDTREIVLALRGPGDVIGEVACLTGRPRAAAVVAVGRVDALRIRAKDFVTFLGRFPHAAQCLYRTVAERLREADRDRLAAASMSVRQRLARQLLKIIDRFGVPAPEGGIKIELLSQGELAGCIGGAPRSVAREMGVWRERKIISTNRLSVTVHEPQLLRRIAGLHAPPP